MADHSMLHELVEWVRNNGAGREVVTGLLEAQVFHVGTIASMPEPRSAEWKQVRAPFPRVALEFSGDAGAQFSHLIINVEQLPDDSEGFACWAAVKGRAGEWVCRELIAGRHLGGGAIGWMPGLAPTEAPGDVPWLLAAHVFDVLRCVNVVTQDQTAPVKLNAKRVARGKVPLFSYKTLSLAVPNIRRNGASAGGTHASPRVHLRRGHIRRLSDDRAIWVQPCVVGSKHGLVQKDYRLVAKAAAV